MTCRRSEFSPSMWVPVSFQGLNSGWQACAADTFLHSAISLAPCAYFCYSVSRVIYVYWTLDLCQTDDLKILSPILWVEFLLF